VEAYQYFKQRINGNAHEIACGAAPIRRRQNHQKQGRPGLRGGRLGAFRPNSQADQADNAQRLLEPRNPKPGFRVVVRVFCKHLTFSVQSTTKRINRGC